MRIFGLAFFLFISGSALALSVRVQVVDVGQADGIVIRTPNKNNWIVIDAGIGEKFAKYLVEMGVNKLDMAVVTHRHKDHQHGMPRVIEKIPIDLFVGVTEDCPNRIGDDKVREKIVLKQVTVHTLSSTPKILTIDGVTFTILPLPSTLAKCPDDENLNSIVVRMDYGDFSMLFTGDAEEETLDWLVQNHSDLLDVDVLKASHLCRLYIAL